MENNERSGLDRRRYWVVFFVLVSLGFIAAGFWHYRFETDHIRQREYRQIRTIAELKAGQIQQWRLGRLSDVVKAAKSPFFIRGVEEWLRNPHVSSYQESLKERLHLEQTYNVYSDLFVASADGRILFPPKPKSGPVSKAEKLAIAESLKNRKAVLSELYYSNDGKIHIDAIAPVINRQGVTIAMAVFRSDAQTFLYPLIQSWPTTSRSAETLIVRKDGSDVLFLNKLRNRPDAALSLREPLTSTDVPAVQAVMGRQGMFIGKDYRGVEVMADLRPMPQSAWFMVAKVDTVEILSEARYRAGVIFLVVSLFVLLAASITAYTYRRRQAGIYKKLYRIERKEKESRELFRTTLYSIGDAVITTDNLGFIMYMNRVAEEHTGWQEAEAKGKPLEKIFHIVNENTREKVESPVERVLSEGEIIGLANHTVLIAKDGSERPIADSGAPIRDEQGEIIGVVMVFRDQTAERRAREELRRERDFADGLIDTAQTIILVLDIEGKIVRFNRYMEELSGYTLAEVKGKDWFSTFLPMQDHGKIREIFKRAIGDIKTRGNVNAIITKDGRKCYIEWYDKTLMDADGNAAGLLSIGQDVTERRLAEEALKPSIREKDILLREIHHRVKNNLQIISSLLILESEYGKARDINTVLRESRDRIRTMAIVHEKFYRTPDMSSIRIKGYITDLTNQLISSYPVRPGKIQVNIKVQDIDLSIDHAIPFGLIINELFTNAMKHAFPDDAKGEIAIKLEEHTELQTITLTVADNGKGISDAANVKEPETLGLRLVRILAEEQLNGKLEIEHEGGTKFSITFRRSELI